MSTLSGFEVTHFRRGCPNNNFAQATVAVDPCRPMCCSSCTAGSRIPEASTRPTWNPRMLPAGVRNAVSGAVSCCVFHQEPVQMSPTLSAPLSMPRWLGDGDLLAASCSTRHRSRMGPAPCGTAENDHSRGHCAWAGWRNVSSFRMTRNPDTVARKLHTLALAVATGLCRRRCDLEAFCVR